MQIFINGLALHDLGKVIVRSQASTFEPVEAPHRERVTLALKIVFNQLTWADNYALVKEVHTALRTQEPTLLWKNENGATELERTVMVLDSTLPEDPNAWGTRLQAIELSLAYYQKDLTTGNVSCTYRRLGPNKPTVTLSTVEHFKDKYSSARVNSMRAERIRDGGQVTLTGKFLPNPLLPVAERRAQMIAAATAWKTELVAGSAGTLVFGEAFDEIVRIDEFDCDIDQARNEIPWSLTATFTRFPDEDTYATAEFTVRTRQDRETGLKVMGLAGEIGAATKLIALNKLAALRTQFIPEGFVGTSVSLNEGQFSGDDGDAFIKLSFEEEYQSGSAGIVRWALKVTDATETRNGLTRRTYSGTVTASASSHSAAFTSAVAYAQSLGDNKHQFQVSRSLTHDDHPTQTDAPRFVTVEFMFEYQLKANKIYLEVNSETTKSMFEENGESVSGYVVAGDIATARAAYASLVRNAYNGRLVRNERTGEARQRMQSVNLANGSLQGSYTTQELRLDFSFTVLLEKGDTEVAIKYAMEVRRNFRTLEKQTTVQGKVYARDTETNEAGGLFRTSGKKIRAEAVLDTFLATLNAGNRVESTRSDEVDYSLGNPNTPSEAIRKSLVLNFAETFEGVIAGGEQIIECERTEELEHSGPRLVVQGVHTGRDVVQQCGIMSGRRTVSGTVTAATETTAMAWAQAQRARLTGDHQNPPRFTRTDVFVPLSAGEEGDVRMVKVGFSFSEVLVDLDYQP
jgi:hypothetical protein